MDPYSTHLEPIKRIFSYIEKPNLTIEFGMGNYSTDYFIKNSVNTISIEMQSKDWYDNILNKFSQFNNWDAKLLLGPLTYRNLKTITPDVSFIDGHGDSRPDCVNDMITINCPVIIAHDTETASYGWHRVNPMGYKRFDFKEYSVWTTLWTNDLKLFNKL